MRGISPTFLAVGVLFATTSRAHVFALDAATGGEKWRFDPTVYGSVSQGHNRGVVYWSGNEAGDIREGRLGGARILAASGNDLWQDTLPAAGYATPSTYTVAGRQFVVVAAGGGKLGTKSGSKYVAYALP